MQLKGNQVDWGKIVTENYELAEAAIKTNYFGAKEMSTTLIPLLQLSDSPRIVNVTSSIGRLEVCDSNLMISSLWHIQFGSSLNTLNL